MVNLWEDMETGPNAPDEIYAVVECLKGERNKYEYDKDIPGVVLDRVLHSNVHYPSDYGFIPQTYYDDEDPFDVLVLVEDQTFPGCVIEARPVALMKMDDDGEQDDKVIAVPSRTPATTTSRTSTTSRSRRSTRLTSSSRPTRTSKPVRKSRRWAGRTNRPPRTPSNTRWTLYEENFA